VLVSVTGETLRRRRGWVGLLLCLSGHGWRLLRPRSTPVRPRHGP